MTERRENIARALAAADEYDMSLWCSPILCVFIPEQDRYRRLADAAIAADGLQAPLIGDLLHAAREWIWRHSSQPDGDRWMDNPGHLDWAAQNLLIDLKPWLTDTPDRAADDLQARVEGVARRLMACHGMTLDRPGEARAYREAAEWIRAAVDGADSGSATT